MNVKINSTLYPAVIDGWTQDNVWDGRESKAITMRGTYAEASALFSNGMEWSIVSDPYEAPVLDAAGNPVVDENGSLVTETRTDEYDNSDFSVLGDITVHTDGTVTVKMGKPTDLEEAYAMIYGGVQL